MSTPPPTLTELAIWVRNPEGCILESIAANPAVSLLYGYFEPNERFVMLVITQGTVQGRAGFGLRRDAPVFPEKRGRFTCPKDEGSCRCPRYGGFDLPSPGLMASCPHWFRQRSLVKVAFPADRATHASYQNSS